MPKKRQTQRRRRGRGTRNSELVIAAAKKVHLALLAPTEGRAVAEGPTLVRDEHCARAGEHMARTQRAQCDTGDKNAVGGSVGQPLPSARLRRRRTRTWALPPCPSATRPTWPAQRPRA